MATIKRRAGGTNSTVLIRREYSTAFSPTSIAGCQLWLDGAEKTEQLLEHLHISQVVVLTLMDPLIS